MSDLWNRFWDIFDPERKGPLFWRYGWKGILFIAAATYFMYQWFVGPRHSPFAGVLWLMTIGIHEAGHPIFRMISGGNFAWTIWGGTVMELGVPFRPTYAFYCWPSPATAWATTPDAAWTRSSPS